MFLGVYCLEDCSFQIRAKYSGDNYIEIGDQMIMTFPDKDDVGELKLWVDQDDEEYLTHIWIEAYLMNPEDVAGDIRLFIN